MVLQKNEKIIGTFVPLSALSSRKLKDKDQGTIEAGIAFLNWLKKVNQSAWQMLPLHQTQLEKNSASERVPSPYKGYGIGLDPRYLPSKYKSLIPSQDDIKKFLQENSYWINDYTLFSALTKHFKTDDWRKWDKDIKIRSRDALIYWSKVMKKDIDEQILIQYQLHKSYDELRKEAKRLKISIIGDLPFYLSLNSPLVWANQELFQLGIDGDMKFVSGIPDKYNSHYGRQIWGHPLYKWNSKLYKNKIISFWEERLCYLSNFFDIVRIDHAKAFFEYGKINLSSEENDRFEKGPGLDVFREIYKKGTDCGIMIFAEDAGVRLAELRSAMNEIGVPGVKIFRYAYNEKLDKVIDNYADIDSYPENSVAYTTTHDTDSLTLYIKELNLNQKKQLSLAAKVKYIEDDIELAKLLRKRIITSPSKIVILPMQDWLLTTERINIPGTEKEKGDKNWNYKLKIPVEEIVIP
jgi:4-alpha-glucanotransferase